MTEVLSCHISSHDRKAHQYIMIKHYLCFFPIAYKIDKVKFISFEMNRLEIVSATTRYIIVVASKSM